MKKALGILILAFVLGGTLWLFIRDFRTQRTTTYNSRGSDRCANDDTYRTITNGEYSYEAPPRWCSKVYAAGEIDECAMESLTTTSNGHVNLEIDIQKKGCEQDSFGKSYREKDGYTFTLRGMDSGASSEAGEKVLFDRVVESFKIL